MGCYNQYKARGCSYTECKSQHVTHFGTLGKTLIMGRGVSEVLPLQKKGGADFFLAVLKGGGAQKVMRKF